MKKSWWNSRDQKTKRIEVWKEASRQTVGGIASWKSATKALFALTTTRLDQNFAKERNSNQEQHGFSSY